MNKQLLAIFFLAQIFCSGAVFVNNPSNTHFQVLSQLRDINDSEFGKRILDTIALQIQNNSPLGDVAKMLAEIRGNLKAQQKTDDMTYSSTMGDCKETKTRLSEQITKCQAHANSAEEATGSLHSEIKSISKKIKSMGTQIKILISRKKQLDLARRQDAADFAKRQEQGPAVLEALDLIVNKLKSIKPTSAAGAFAELARIGNTNPIASLLQVASTFSKKTLDNVIGKMIALQKSIKKSLEGDVENEKKSIASYEKIKSELASTLKNIKAAKSEAESTKEQKETSKKLQEKKFADNTKCVAGATKANKKKTKECNEAEAKYNADKKARAKELAIILQVEKIVATKLDSMKAYVKDAMNS